MSVQVIEYIKKNESKFINIATKMCRSVEVGEDILQKTYLFFLENPKDSVEHLDSYIFLTIRGRYYNYIRDKRRLKRGQDTVFVEDLDKIIEHDEGYYKKTYTTVEINNVLKIMNLVCAPAEIEAITHTLLTDDTLSGCNGKSFETIKASRRNGIKKIQKYLQLGVL